MDIILFLSKFFYRIRYWLLWGSIIVTGLVIYFTQFLPYKYTVNSSLYAGVTSNTNSMTSDGLSIFSINSTFDNLINIAKSKGTLEKVSTRLLATCYVYGDENQDTKYILARNYRALIKETPKEILSLVNRKSLDETVNNFIKYRKEDSKNFIYSIFSRPYNRFFSFKVLNTISVRRLNTSDLIEISYTNSDPGITQHTVRILEEELVKAYEDLRFGSTNNVIAYFEEQVRKSKAMLQAEEDDLMHYNVEKEVINYGEQTKALAITKYEVDDRYEQVLRQYESAVELVKLLEDKMDIRAQILRNKTNLLSELNKVSSLNEKIMEQEIFVSDQAKKENGELLKNKRALQKAEENISTISDRLNEYSFSKEGVGIENMVSEWLQAVINEAKAKAELKVMDTRRNEISEQYREFSPVGTQVNRKERSIGIVEDTYREQLRGLSEARLRLKNIEMTTANLKVITPPEYPLTDTGRRRTLYIIAAFIGSLIFITFYFLVIELLDRTLRDPERSKRLTGLPVIAAFNGVSNLKYRGFLKLCNRTAAAYTCQQLNNYIQKNRPTIINLLSMEKGEGKSFLAQYFIQYWETENLHVRYVNYAEDFDIESKSYVQAQELSDFWQLNSAESTPDILLIEYPAFKTASLPYTVLQKSDVNLLIANACRLWAEKDDKRLKNFKEIVNNVPLFLYLNNADRDVVESFTGELPPESPVHSFFNRIAQLGLTSKKAAVK